MKGKVNEERWYKVSDTDLMRGRSRAEALQAYKRMKAFEKKGEKHDRENQIIDTMGQKRYTN